MSDPTAPAAVPADPTSTWDAIAAKTQQILATLSPLIDVAETIDPALAPAFALGSKIAQGVLALEPKAVDLYKRFMSGNPPTEEEVAAYEATYEADYQELKADVAEAKAAAEEVPKDGT